MRIHDNDKDVTYQEKSIIFETIVKCIEKINFLNVWPKDNLIVLPLLNLHEHEFRKYYQDFNLYSSETYSKIFRDSPKRYKIQKPKNKLGITALVREKHVTVSYVSKSVSEAWKVNPVISQAFDEFDFYLGNAERADLPKRDIVEYSSMLILLEDEDINFLIDFDEKAILLQAKDFIDIPDSMLREIFPTTLLYVVYKSAIETLQNKTQKRVFRKYYIEDSNTSVKNCIPYYSNPT
jgi:hypothetical protein